MSWAVQKLPQLRRNWYGKKFRLISIRFLKIPQ
ncbi:MAG: hypothetical protein GX200_04465 [Firmicutes bacterium]|nr:hypothetical protein [Bacillota bacterium]